MRRFISDSGLEAIGAASRFRPWSTQTQLIKVTFRESILSIRNELEWSDFDRNQLIAFQLAVMNTKNPFWREGGGAIRGLNDPLLFTLFFKSYIDITSPFQYEMVMGWAGGVWGFKRTLTPLMKTQSELPLRSSRFSATFVPVH